MELEGFKRGSAPTAGCSAFLKGHFSLVSGDSRSVALLHSAPNSLCKVRFDLAGPLTASAAS